MAAVKIARTNIAEALQSLSKSIDTAQHLENSAISLFTEFASELMKIIGPEGARFSNQTAECNSEIVKLEKQKQNLFDNIANLKGELEKYNNLVHVTEIQVHGNKKALEETRSRANEMEKLNQKVDEAIKAIPSTINRTETTHETFGWWFWKTESVTNTIVSLLNMKRD